MHVLVTGSAGLIGSAVAALLRRRHHVTGLDLTPGPEVDIVADIRAPLRLEGFDAVVHTDYMNFSTISYLAFSY